MNERIRELAQQSDGIVICKMMTGRKQYTFLEEDLEKFAELIVKECADVLVAEMNRLDGLDRVVAAQTMDAAQVLIKQHFGVE